MTITQWRTAVCALPLVLLGARVAAQTPATTPASARASRGELRLRFVGWAGWEITDGRTAVLVDPRLSREMHDSIGRARGVARLTPAEFAELHMPPQDSATLDARVTRADFILVTHGHPDHALDAPYIARKRGAVIIGNESVVNIARAYGVPDTNLITVVGGEDYEFGSFSLKIIPNLHTVSTAPCCNKRFYSSLGAGPRRGE